MVVEQDERVSGSIIGMRGKVECYAQDRRLRGGLGEIAQHCRDSRGIRVIRVA